MADNYDALYKLLCGIIAAKMEIEKRNHGNARTAPDKERRAAVVILEAGDLDNPALMRLLRLEGETLKN